VVGYDDLVVGPGEVRQQLVREPTEVLGGRLVRSPGEGSDLGGVAGLVEEGDEVELD
jgi:hypothetical protein